MSSQNKQLHDSFIQSLSSIYGHHEGFCVIEAPQDEAKTFVFFEPTLKVWADADGSYICNGDRKVSSYAGVWDAFKKHISPLYEKKVEQQIPFAAGYLGYDLCRFIENVPACSDTDLILPLYLFYIYRTVIGINGTERSAHFNSSPDAEPFWEFDKSCLQSRFIAAKKNVPDDISLQALENELQGNSNFSRLQYCAAIEDIKELIRDGKVYQVNLSQRFKLPYKSHASDFYSELKNVSDSPYSCYLRGSNAGEAFTIASSSPELFMASDGVNLRCSPIKGTRRRGLTDLEDAELRQSLMHSEKDLAELAMIVDLVRNDMGRIAEISSVVVKQHARLQTLAQVHHLVTDVTCRVRESVDFIDVVKAMFPCGSITGAPKVAAMKIIAIIEDISRNVYTGSIGWLSANRAFQFNVAIRTAVIAKQELYFQAGGGIVIDSDAASEYDETLSKAKGIYLAWQNTQDIFANAL